MGMFLWRDSWTTALLPTGLYQLGSTVYLEVLEDSLLPFIDEKEDLFEPDLIGDHNLIF